MIFRKTTLLTLADMICGNEPYGEFPYRSSYFLSRFFQNLGLDYTHDGGTRRYWVESVLEQLDEMGDADSQMPSQELMMVIESLLDDEYFTSDNPKADWDKAVDRLNEVLRRYDLQVQKQKVRREIVPHQ